MKIGINEVNPAYTSVIGRLKYANRKGDVYKRQLIYQPLKELSGVGILLNGQIHSGNHGMSGELSFLPGLSKQQQFEYLKTYEGTLKLLTAFIITLMITCLLYTSRCV